MKFWRTPSRKIYAVEKENVRGKQSRSPRFAGTNGTHPDNVTASSTAEPCQQPQEVVTKYFKELKTDIQAVQLALWGKSGLPSSLQTALQHAFKCKICQNTPFDPPVIMAKCCTSIIGCQKCVDSWFTGPNALSKTCPLCQQERGYANLGTLHGFDEVTEEVKKLFISLEQEGPAE